MAGTLSSAFTRFKPTCSGPSTIRTRAQKAYSCCIVSALGGGLQKNQRLSSACCTYCAAHIACCSSSVVRAYLSVARLLVFVGAAFVASRSTAASKCDHVLAVCAQLTDGTVYEGIFHTLTVDDKDVHVVLKYAKVARDPGVTAEDLQVQ